MPRDRSVTPGQPFRPCRRLFCFILSKRKYSSFTHRCLCVCKGRIRRKKKQKLVVQEKRFKRSVHAKTCFFFCYCGRQQIHLFIHSTSRTNGRIFLFLKCWTDGEPGSSIDSPKKRGWSHEYSDNERNSKNEIEEGKKREGRECHYPTMGDDRCCFSSLLMRHIFF